MAAIAAAIVGAGVAYDAKVRPLLAPVSTVPYEVTFATLLRNLTKKEVYVPPLGPFNTPERRQPNEHTLSQALRAVWISIVAHRRAYPTRLFPHSLLSSDHLAEYWTLMPREHTYKEMGTKSNIAYNTWLLYQMAMEIGESKVVASVPLPEWHDTTVALGEIQRMWIRTHQSVVPRDEVDAVLRAAYQWTESVISCEFKQTKYVPPVMGRTATEEEAARVKEGALAINSERAVAFKQWPIVVTAFAFSVYWNRWFPKTVASAIVDFPEAARTTSVFTRIRKGTERYFFDPGNGVVHKEISDVKSLTRFTEFIYESHNPVGCYEQHMSNPTIHRLGQAAIYRAIYGDGAADGMDTLLAKSPAQIWKYSNDNEESQRRTIDGTFLALFRHYMDAQVHGFTFDDYLVGSSKLRTVSERLLTPLRIGKPPSPLILVIGPAIYVHVRDRKDCCLFKARDAMDACVIWCFLLRTGSDAVLDSSVDVGVRWIDMLYTLGGSCSHVFVCVTNRWQRARRRSKLRSPGYWVVDTTREEHLVRFRYGFHVRVGWPSHNGPISRRVCHSVTGWISLGLPTMTCPSASNGSHSVHLESSDTMLSPGLDRGWCLRGKPR